MKGTTLSDLQRQLVERDYRTGQFSLRDLAQQFKVSLETVRQILKRRGVPINAPYVRLRRS